MKWHMWPQGRHCSNHHHHSKLITFTSKGLVETSVSVGGSVSTTFSAKAFKSSRSVRRPWVAIYFLKAITFSQFFFLHLCNRRDQKINERTIVTSGRILRYKTYEKVISISCCKSDHPHRCCEGQLRAFSGAKLKTVYNITNIYKSVQRHGQSVSFHHHHLALTYFHIAKLDYLV